MVRKIQFEKIEQLEIENSPGWVFLIKQILTLTAAFFYYSTEPTWGYALPHAKNV